MTKVTKVCEQFLGWRLGAAKTIVGLARIRLRRLLDEKAGLGGGRLVCPSPSEENFHGKKQGSPRETANIEGCGGGALPTNFQAKNEETFQISAAA